MALKQLTTDRFERNFSRLLRVFATDLKTEAQDHQEASVVRFMAARATYVASYMDVVDIVDQKDFVGPEESEPDAADPAEQSPLRNLQDVRSFIPNSVAFSTLGQKLHDFVVHGKVQNQQPADSREQNLDIGPSDVPTRPEEYSLEISDTDSDNPQQVEDGEANKSSISEGQVKMLGNIFVALKYAWRMVAEFLELLENPIPPGFRRYAFSTVGQTYLGR
ncbi:MAG: hypothetical protein L6R37_002998 [Teloschistes peruensis]|nr:MAG: hypothetical protein L6R37_002998 [Teloschistes peruensis]